MRGYIAGRVVIATQQSSLLLPLLAALAAMVGADPQVAMFSGSPFAASISDASHASMPGHYEFEMAPKMEPPSVRKPPYRQSPLSCPGAEPFAGFSPRDTLCGDLNLGAVPANPLGQSIAGQSYPFELIKNKTLQFLARALPVLKLEYETIPKVARYLPSAPVEAVAIPGQSDLLNPTSLGSSLSHDQLSAINEHFAASNGFSADDLLATTPDFVRRRKRSTGGPQAFASGQTTSTSGSGGSGSGFVGQVRQTGSGSVAAATFGSPIGELSTNASLVISSAHSSSFGRHHLPGGSGGGPRTGSANELTVITKDGYKPVIAVSGSVSVAPSSSSSLGSVSSGNAGGGRQSAQVQSQPQTQLHSAQQQQQQQQQQPKSPASHRENHVSGAGNNGNSASYPQQQQQQQQVVAHVVVGASNSASSTNSNSAGPDAREQNESQGRSANGETPASNGHTLLKQENVSASSPASQQQAKRRVSCAESPSAITSAICQAAAHLIEGERPPAWLQLIKHLGAAYSGASDSVGATPSSGPASLGSPLWSLLSGLTQEQPLSAGAKSAGSGSAGGSPQTGSGGSTRTTGSQSSTHSSPSTTSLMSLVGPLMSFISGSSAKDASSLSSSSSSVADRKSDQGRNSLVSSLGSSTMARLALAGWASSALASLVEYFVPTAFSSAGRTFARRKKPYDPTETFVDTPASVAAALSARTGASALPTAAKQPPTPCPSVEEYISPTFARNYQGAWKYVVQIPHEGYFTQTIQRTSCVRQRCEFTDGLCHESPRWVSLLVAEIYYPNTVFGSGGVGATASSQTVHGTPAAGVGPGQMAAAPSTSSVQRLSQQQQQQLLGSHQGQQPRVGVTQSGDPLQMTDSLNNYNHNQLGGYLAAALAANDLASGWDASSLAGMQHQLNSAYNYQLLQRQGNLATPSGQAEQRVSTPQRQASGNLAASNQQSQQLQNQYQLALQQQQYQVPAGWASNDYISALAAATLQQNPHLSLQDLIQSLSLSQAKRRRKKRDLTGGEQASQLGRQQQVQANGRLQADSATPLQGSESMPSMNELNSQNYNSLQFAYATNPSNFGSSTASQQQMMQQQQLQQQQQQQHFQFKQHPSSSVRSQHQAQQQSQQGLSNTIQGDASQPMASIGIPPSNELTNSQDATSGSQPSSSSGSSLVSASSSSSNVNNSNNNNNNNNNNNGNNMNQECDGHDKIGCYVVRVYYDWFLVNGSCKCWKTNGSQNQSNGQNSGSTGNSLIRRIFTG